jgi:predicted ATPase
MALPRAGRLGWTPSRRMSHPSPPPYRLPASAGSARWQVRLLGGFEIDDGRHRLTLLRSRASMALLARLALEPAREHPREELADRLWPEADAVTGRSRLRQTLSLLKAVLEPAGSEPVILADRRALRVVPGAFWCDARAFEQALHAGQHGLALDLYCGELLPGHYDEWIVEERRRLARLAERLAAWPPNPPAATAQPPAPAAPDAARLPHYLTRLIGADAETARLLAALAEHRLVTVLGPGGAGKTRLAIEAARRLVEPGAGARFERAVFVSLVAATRAAELLDRMLQALRIEGAGEPREQVRAALAGPSVLMVLDNVEQLDDTAATEIAYLAEHNAGVHWLLTSRRPLGLDGECHFVLTTLPTPPPSATLADVAANPAVALFVDRARAHRSDFHVHAGNAPALVALVAQLDGLPLAIELAASHVRTLGPAELLALLQAARADARTPTGALAYLARRGSRSGSDGRHASMLAVVEWSWHLLSAPAQRLLTQLALLPAGATLQAASALAADGVAAAQACLDEGVAHSVLRLAAGQDGRTRYAVYEPVREYALAQGGPAAQRARRRQVLSWLLAWARTLPPTPPLSSVRDELPNVQQALAAAPADGDGDDAVRLVLQLQSSWGEIAIPPGMLEVLDGLLATPELDDALAAGGHALAAWCCQEAGRAEMARRHLARALARPCPDPGVRAMVLSRGARLRWRLDRDASGARALAAEALPLARAVGNANTEAALLSLEGHLASVVERDSERAAALSVEALQQWQRSGNRHLVNAGRYNLAVTAINAGRPASVLDELAALADEGRALQDWDLASGALDARGTALLARRRWPEAAASFRDALVLAWEGMQMLSVVFALWNVAPVFARLRRAELAARTMGAAELQWTQRFGDIDASDERDLRRVRRFCRALIGPMATRKAWHQGREARLGDVVRGVLDALAEVPAPVPPPLNDIEAR